MSPIVTVLLSVTTLFSGELFDPFSGLEGYMQQNPDLRRSKGEILFYADLGFLRGQDEGETKLVLMLSIPESELSFNRSEEGYFAKYRLSIYWKDLESGKAREKIWDKKYNRAEGIREGDAIHTVKTYLSLQKGRYKIEIEVEDQNARKFGHVPIEIFVPEFWSEKASLSTLFLHSDTIVQGGSCDEVSLDHIDPKALGLYRYSKDTVAYYIETYGVVDDSVGAHLKVTIVDSTGGEKWSEEKILSGTSKNCPSLGGVESDRLDLGEYRIHISLQDPNGMTIFTRERSFFVTSSDRWIEDHFEYAVEYLEYIASVSEMKVLKSAPFDQRLDRWKEFWKKRDPLPATTVNESLVEYYRRLQFANRHFTTQIEKGWRTDRGRVYLTLGPPDESIVREGQGIFGTWEIWVYDRSLGFRTILYFEDRGFTDDYRLVNPGAFIRAKSRLE
jgi:GWxTD domain-containing protein